MVDHRFLVVLYAAGNVIERKSRQNIQISFTIPYHMDTISFEFWQKLLQLWFNFECCDRRPKVKSLWSQPDLWFEVARSMIAQHLKSLIQERSKVHNFWLQILGLVWFRSWWFVGRQILWQSSSLYVVRASHKFLAKFTFDPLSASFWFHNPFLSPKRWPSVLWPCAQQSDFNRL